MPSYVAFPFPTFQPALRLIQSITNGFPCTVTTTFNHQYKTGTIVRLDILPGSGMPEANQLFSPIIVTSPTTFTMNLDTTTFDPFVLVGDAQSQAIPIGEVSSMLTAATQNVLPY